MADCSLERSQVASSICQKFHLHSRIDGNTTLINSIFPQRCTMIWFYLSNWWRHLKVAAFVKSPLDFMQKTRICKWGIFSFIVKSRKQIYEFVCIGSLFLLQSFPKSQCLANAWWSNSRFHECLVLTSDKSTIIVFPFLFSLNIHWFDVFCLKDCTKNSFIAMF